MDHMDMESQVTHFRWLQTSQNHQGDGLKSRNNNSVEMISLHFWLHGLLFGSTSHQRQFADLATARANILHDTQLG